MKTVLRNRAAILLAACGVAAIGSASSAVLAGEDDGSMALRSELSADAVARSQYMEKANGFVITDGTNKLRVGGWAQFRYFLNFRDDPANTTGGAHDSGFTNGFELARTRLNFSGNVLDPNLKFKLEGDFSRSTGDFGLLDAFVTYTLPDNPQLSVRGGQFKAPLLREQLVADTAQLTAERSIVDAVFNQGRTQGVELQYVGDAFRGTFCVNDGLNALNTAYTSTTESDIGVTARGELKFGEGEWKRYDDFTSFRKSTVGGMIGAAVHWQHAGNTATPFSPPASPVAQTDLFVYTLDASVEGDGWNFFGEFVGSHFEGDNSAGDADDFGAVLQGGVFVTDQDEIFARWDAVFPDSDRAGNEDFHTITAGFNHYFVPESHALVFTADVCWFLDDTVNNSLVAGKAGNRTGLLPSGEDDQFAIRFQLQFMF